MSPMRMTFSMFTGMVVFGEKPGINSVTLVLKPTGRGESLKP